MLLLWKMYYLNSGGIWWERLGRFRRYWNYNNEWMIEWFWWDVLFWMNRGCLKWWLKRKGNDEFFITLSSVVLIGVFDEMLIPVIVWVFPTDSHELEYPLWWWLHVYEWCETSHSLCLWNEMRCVWWEWDDYLSPIPFTV